MAAMKRGLGRGLDALLSTVEQVHEPVVEDSAKPLDGYRLLSVDAIQRGRYQPRRDLEPGALEELADSIRAQGIMQPIVVRSVEGNNRFEIIAGERRWRAGQMAGLTEIPALVREVPDEAAIAMALIENIQRENLNPIEEAVALQRLQQEFELTQQQVAKAVGKSRSTIANLLRLMKLEEEVKKMLDYGDLEMGHARALLALESEAQLEAARDVVARGLTVRQTEALVRKLQSPQSQPVEPTQPDPALEQLAGELSARFSAPVSISRNVRGKGKISISYNSEAELNAILENLK